MNLSPGSFCGGCVPLDKIDKVVRNFKVVDALIGVSITSKNIMGYFSCDTDA